MAYFQNDDLEYVVNDYYGDVIEFEEDNDAFADNQPHPSLEVVDDNSDDFEDDLDSSKVKSDTSALEARNGKDIQGIPWERLNFTRDKYREARLKQYKNYESLGRPRQDLEKECLQVEKGKSFYDFHYNTRLVKSTIVHFQLQRKGICLLMTFCPSWIFLWFYSRLLISFIIWGSFMDDVYFLLFLLLLHSQCFLIIKYEIFKLLKINT